MADQSARQPFRFRIPWITTTTAPPAPRPPTVTQPTTSARPPFRPPGVAPPRPTTTSSQAPPRNESRPPSPAKIIPLQSRPSSSPIRTAPHPKVVSQPPSPSNSTESQPQATSQPPEGTPRPPSPSLITPKPQIASQLPSPPPTPLESQAADQTSQNPTSLSLISTQQEAETQKSTMPQLIKSPKSQPQQPSIATTSPTTSEPPPPPQNLQPELNTPQPRDEIKEKKTIAQSQQEEMGPIPVVEQRNQASQLGRQGKESDSNGEVVASGEEEKTLQKAAHTNVQAVPLREIRDNISKFAQRISDHPENIIDENSVSVITLTGENTGATMKLGIESGQNESKIHIYRGYKLSQEDVSEATTDGENNNPKRKSKGILGFMLLSIIIEMIQQSRTKEQRQGKLISI